MEYSFDINSEIEKFELYYLKCICAGRAHEGFYIVYPSKMQRQTSIFYLQLVYSLSNYSGNNLNIISLRVVRFRGR